MLLFHASIFNCVCSSDRAHASPMSHSFDRFIQNRLDFNDVRFLINVILLAFLPAPPFPPFWRSMGCLFNLLFTLLFDSILYAEWPTHKQTYTDFQDQYRVSRKNRFFLFVKDMDFLLKCIIQINHL